MADTVTGKDRVWWCSDRSNEGEPANEGDVIKYSERAAHGSWSTPQTVLTPSFSAWEGQCTCDPAVVRGNFTFNGQLYAMAMYYTASPTCSTDNKVGVAFSNDGISWVKYGSYVIETQFTTNRNQRYGAGQAQARNWNGQAGVQLETCPRKVSRRYSLGLAAALAIPLRRSARRPSGSSVNPPYNSS